MGVVTWKNIAPSNPAGILSAANQAAKTMGEGFSGVGTALQGGVDKKVQSETDQFVADLMSLGTQEERDAMIAEAESGWLNLDTINKTNYELGAPEREQAAYEKQLASSHYFNKLMETYKADEQIRINNEKPVTPKKSSSSSIIGGDRTADEKKGIFNPTNKVFTELEEDDEGILASWTAFGSDYGEGAQQRVQTFNNKFLTTYGKSISEEDLNVAFNTGILRWEDDYSTDNDFYFELDGKTVGLNDENADKYLYEKLMDEKFNEQSRINEKAGYEVKDPEIYRTHESKVKAQYFDEFEKNNPKLKEVELENLFFNIWNANTDSINTGKFSDTSKGIELFKTITDAKDVTADMEWDGGWYTGPGSGYVEFIKKRDALRKSAKEALSK
jgi:hypothetical protein